MVGILGEIATFYAGLTMLDANFYTPAPIRVVLEATYRVERGIAGYLRAIVATGLSVNEAVARSLDFSTGATERAQHLRW